VYDKPLSMRVLALINPGKLTRARPFALGTRFLSFIMRKPPNCVISSPIQFSVLVHSIRLSAVSATELSRFLSLLGVPSPHVQVLSSCPVGGRAIGVALLVVILLGALGMTALQKRFVSLMGTCGCADSDTVACIVRTRMVLIVDSDRVVSEINPSFNFSVVLNDD
jgi:hypothetical protein